MCAFACRGLAVIGALLFAATSGDAYSKENCDVEVMDLYSYGGRFSRPQSGGLYQGRYYYHRDWDFFLYYRENQWVLSKELGSNDIFAKSSWSNADDPTDASTQPWETWAGSYWVVSSMWVRQCGQTGERLLTITIESGSDMPDTDTIGGPDVQIEGKFSCSNCETQSLSTAVVMNSFNPVWYSESFPSSYYSLADCRNALLQLEVWDQDGSNWEYIGTARMWCNGVNNFGYSSAHSVPISTGGSIDVRFAWGPPIKARCYVTSYLALLGDHMTNTCNADFHYSPYLEAGKSCSIRCEEGYDGNAYTVVTCTNDNVWTGYLESCRALGQGCTSTTFAGECGGCEDSNSIISSDARSCVCKPGFEIPDRKLLRFNCTGDGDCRNTTTETPETPGGSLTCIAWDCFAGNRSFGLQIADMNEALKSSDFLVLQQVLLCAFGVKAQDNSQKAKIKAVVTALKDHPSSNANIQRDAASFLKGYWSSIAGDQVPPFDEEFYKARLDDTIDYLEVFNTQYNEAKTSASFGALFSMQSEQQDKQIIEATKKADDLQLRIDEELAALQSHREDVMATMPKLKHALFEVEQALKNPWQFMGAVLDFVVAVAQFPPDVGAAIQAGVAAGEKAVAIGKAMDELAELIQEVQNEFPDYEKLATSKTGTQWKNFVLELENTLRSICMGDDTDASGECYTVVLRVKQMALHGQDAYSSQLTIANYRKELEMVNLRKTHLTEMKNTVTDLAGKQSGDLSNTEQWNAAYLAKQILVDNLYDARLLLQSYCLSLNYKFAPNDQGDLVCQQTAVIGGADGLVKLVADLSALVAQRDSQLLGTSGATFGYLGPPFDVTHLFDLEQLAETFTQSFRLEPGSLPTMADKLGVEIEEVQVFFEGVNKNFVAVNIQLFPPFYKEWGNAESDPHQYALAPVSFSFSYQKDDGSCPLEKKAAGAYCINSQPPASAFSKPTPYANWVIKLNPGQFTTADVQSITKVLLNVKYYSPNSHNPLTYTPKATTDWTTCATCIQTRQVSCEVSSSSMNTKLLHRSVCEFNDKVLAAEQCCESGGCTCGEIPNPTEPPTNTTGGKRCDAGTENCDCPPSPQVCNAPLTCDSFQKCVCEGGTDGCQCVSGSCSGSLECKLGLCQEVVPTTCPVASNGCPCTAGGMCDPGFACDQLVCRVEGCPVATEGCPCTSGGHCEPGLACAGDKCEAPPCPPATGGCPCDAGQCDAALECTVGGVCREKTCPIASENCPCTSGGRCDAGLKCANDICETCPVASVGCACTSGGLCDADLTCTSDVCAALTKPECPVASEGCPCTSGGLCEGNSECTADVCVRKACPIASNGCPCTSGGLCETGLECKASVCASESQRECPVASEDCPCTSGGMCDADLECTSDTCVVKKCPVASDGCPCTSGGLCDAGLACSDGMCAATGSSSSSTPPPPSTPSSSSGGSTGQEESSTGAQGGDVVNAARGRSAGIAVGTIGVPLAVAVALAAFRL